MIETIFSGTLLLIAWVLSICFAYSMGFNRGWMKCCRKFKRELSWRAGDCFAQKMEDRLK